MANLQEAPGWDDVYQLEVTDPAQGGPGGVMNRQAQALLNRAAYLNNQLQAVVQALTVKAALVHQHDASAIVSGVLDVARIPILPSQNTVTSAGDLTALTADQQAQIVEGVVVTTTDGWRWVYKGSGAKTNADSYIQLADITPDWTVIQNKPSSFPSSPHDHAIPDVTGLQDALDQKADKAQASLVNASGSFIHVMNQDEDLSGPAKERNLIGYFFKREGQALRCISPCTAIILARASQRTNVGGDRSAAITLDVYVDGGNIGSDAWNSWDSSASNNNNQTSGQCVVMTGYPFNGTELLSLSITRGGTGTISTASDVLIVVIPSATLPEKQA